MAYETGDKRKIRVLRKVFGVDSSLTDSAFEATRSAEQVGVPDVLAEAIITGLATMRYDRENERMIVDGSADLARLLTALGIDFPESLLLP